MRRSLLGLCLIFVVLFILGCSNVANFSEVVKSGAYSYEEAVKRGDIVFQAEVENFERFEQFLNNIANKTEDTIRITGYTHEGDPIFEDLHFDGNEIHYTHDNSHDEFAGSDRGITKEVCKEIVDITTEQGNTEYWLSGCLNGNDLWLITVDK